MLAVVINYYSPVAWSQPAENYKTMLAAIREQMPEEALFPVELHFERDEPLDPAAELIKGESQHQYLWQKEAIFNRVCRRLPEKFTKFLMVDADILFDDSDWYRHFTQCLDVYDYAQPFDRCFWLDRGGHVMLSKQACPLAPVWPDFQHYHPGFAIGMTREAFDLTDGLFWRSISGANDCVIPWAFYCSDRLEPHRMNEAAGELPYVKAYGDSVRENNLTLGNSLGTVRHLWHGDRKNRQYVSRHDLLNRVGYRVSDVTLDDDGLLAWTNEDCIAKRAMRKYFYRRREDG